MGIVSVHAKTRGAGEQWMGEGKCAGVYGDARRATHCEMGSVTESML